MEMQTEGGEEGEGEGEAAKKKRKRRSKAEMIAAAAAGEFPPKRLKAVLDRYGVEEGGGEGGGDEGGTERGSSVGGSVNGDEGGGRKRMSGGGGERVRSGFIGVSLNGNRWSARISVAGKKTSLGGYDTEKEAALAYDRASRLQFGDKARCNVSERGREGKREGGREGGTGRKYCFFMHVKDFYFKTDTHLLTHSFPSLPPSLPPFPDSSIFPARCPRACVDVARGGVAEGEGRREAPRGGGGVAQQQERQQGEGRRR